MDDSILCGHCGYPLTYHTGTRVDQECFQAACNAMDLMTDRLRAFGEGLRLDSDHTQILLTATPEQCRQVGETTITTLDAVVIRQAKEISRLEGLIKTHQDSMRETCSGVAKALGYQGPESGDMLEAFARKVREERDQLKTPSVFNPSVRGKAGIYAAAPQPETWNRSLTNDRLAEAYRYEDGLFGWVIRTSGNTAFLASGTEATLEDAIKAALKKAVELDLEDPEALCHKCGLEAEINDGDDASGPPVCCSCYTSGLEAPC